MLERASRGKSPTARSGIWLGIGLLGASGVAVYARRESPPRPPLGLPAVAWPVENSYSRGKAELGWLLFFDRRLSTDGTVACASCHLPERAFADRHALSRGIGKQPGRRNAPALLNRAYGSSQFWDARAASLEEQAKAPLADRKEMTTAGSAGEAHQACIARLRAVPGYRKRFRQVFGTDFFTVEHVARALATFERTLYSGNSPYDRYQAGDREALAPEQVRGMELFFGRASCGACHQSPTFTDEALLNTGVGVRSRKPDLGRFEVTGFEWETRVFKTPTLREVARTAPYMHDGSLATLEAVIDHYDRGGGKNPHLDDRLMPLRLTTQERRDLVAFLTALSGEGWQHVQTPRPEEFPR